MNGISALVEKRINPINPFRRIPVRYHNIEAKANGIDAEEQKKLPTILVFYKNVSACTYYRTLNPIRELVAQGYCNAVFAFLHPAKEYDLKKVDEINPALIIFQRITDQFDLSLVKELQKKYPICNDIDDDLLRIHKTNPCKNGFEKRRKDIKEIYSTVDFMTVSTTSLQKATKKHNKKIYTFQNALDLEYWDEILSNQNATIPMQFFTKENLQDDKFINIGWCGGKSHYVDFKQTGLTAGVEFIINRTNNVRFIFFGYFPPELKKLKQENESRLIFIDVIDLEYYPIVLKQLNLDFALLPLAKNLFNEAKSYIKYLEYSICGYPSITNNGSMYCKLIKDKQNGYIINNWKKDLLKIIKSKKDNNIIKNANKLVRDKFDIKKNIKKLWEIYKKEINSKEVKDE